MDVAASGDVPVVPRVEVQLSVHDGREAVAFYEAAFGARTCFRLGGTDELPEVVAQLQVGSTRFWVEDESPKHGNFSPLTLKAATARLLLVVDDPRQPSSGRWRPALARSTRWPRSTAGCSAAWWTPSATTGRSDGRSDRGPRLIETEKNAAEEQPVGATGDGRGGTRLPRRSCRSCIPERRVLGAFIGRVIGRVDGRGSAPLSGDMRGCLRAPSGRQALHHPERSKATSVPSQWA